MSGTRSSSADRRRQSRFCSRARQQFRRYIGRLIFASTRGRSSMAASSAGRQLYELEGRGESLPAVSRVEIPAKRALGGRSGCRCLLAQGGIALALRPRKRLVAPRIDCSAAARRAYDTAARSTANTGRLQGGARTLTLDGTGGQRWLLDGGGAERDDLDQARMRDIRDGGAVAARQCGRAVLTYLSAASAAA